MRPMSSSNRLHLLPSQSWKIVRSSDKTCKFRGTNQVGGQHTRGRRSRYAQHSANAIDFRWAPSWAISASLAFHFVSLLLVGYDPYANPPNYGNADDIVKENTNKVRRREKGFPFFSSCKLFCVLLIHLKAALSADPIFFSLFFFNIFFLHPLLNVSFLVP